MSQIKLKHSGGNSVIIAAPDSNPASDRTLKLPSDGDGTILTSNSSVGKILQVKQSQKLDAFSHTGTTFTKIAGTDQNGSGSIFCVKITPSSSSNKILVSSQLVFAVSLISNGRLVRTVGGSDTVISIGTDRGNGQASFTIRSASTDYYYSSIPVNCEFLDSPNTTSEVQYSFEVNSNGNTYIAYINRTHVGSSANYDKATASTITAKEIAG